MSLSLYRKYRPQVFADVVGQEHVEKTLVNAVCDGTVAHAYLFCGPRGTGKTTTARLLAKALMCKEGPTSEPDGTCDECLEIAEGTHPDVYELDAASRTGVDNVREEIIGRVQFAPTRGRYKVYIIDEVHMLSTAAFNALLKTLEEPPDHVIFVLCTTDPHKVPETIQSRCQRFDFHRFSIEEIVAYLERICKAEGFSFEPEALEFIAGKSSGGMRDATTALEQVAVFTEGAITASAAAGLFGQVDTADLFEMGDAVARRDAAACFTILDRLIGEGVDLTCLAQDFAAHFRNLYVTALTDGADGIVACSAADLFKYQVQAAAFGGPERLSRAFSLCGELIAELRTSSDQRLSMEVAFARLCHPASELTLESLAERIEALEAGACAGTLVTAVPLAAPVVTAPAIAPAPFETPAAPNASVTPTTPQQGAPAVAAAPEESVSGAPSVQAVQVQHPVASGTPSAAAVSPARLWAAVLSEVKQKDSASGALLSGVNLEQTEEGYSLCFPKDGDFAMKLVDKGEVRHMLEAALEHHVGKAIRLKCYLASAGNSAPASHSAPNAPTTHTHTDPVPVPDPETAELADALSVFGEGVRFEEIEDE